MKDYLASEMVGEVKQKYIKHKSFRIDTVIVVESGVDLLKVDLPFYKEFYNIINVSDLVIKEKDSDRLFIYRNNSLLKVYKPNCDCFETGSSSH